MIAGVAERLFGRSVDAHERQGLRILDVDHRRNVFKDIGQELFAFPKRILGPSPVGDVLVRAEHPCHPAVRVEQRHLADVYPALAAIRPNLPFVVAEPG